jgi:hypothetical protein
MRVVKGRVRQALKETRSCHKRRIEKESQHKKNEEDVVQSATEGFCRRMIDGRLRGRG